MQATSVQAFFVKPALTGASNIKSNVPMCEHDSPKPAIHAQCAVSTDVPVKFITTHGKGEFSLSLLRWHDLSFQYHKI